VIFIDACSSIFEIRTYIVLMTGRETKQMFDFNAPTEHTRILYIVGKTIKRTLIISRSPNDIMDRFSI